MSFPCFNAGLSDHDVHAFEDQRMDGSPAILGKAPESFMAARVEIDRQASFDFPLSLRPTWAAQALRYRRGQFTDRGGIHFGGCFAEVRRGSGGSGGEGVSGCRTT
jgi:hypothetical protein